MKVGDLVRVNESHWHRQGEVGVLFEDIFDKGKAFRVMFTDGVSAAKLKKNLELIKTDKNCP